MGIFWPHKFSETLDKFTATHAGAKCLYELIFVLLLHVFALDIWLEDEKFSWHHSILIPPLKILDHCSELAGAEARWSKEPQGFLNVFSRIQELTFRDLSSVGLSSPICKMNMMLPPHRGIGRFNYILKFFTSVRAKTCKVWLQTVS